MRGEERNGNEKKKKFKERQLNEEEKSIGKEKIGGKEMK